MQSKAGALGFGLCRAKLCLKHKKAKGILLVVGRRQLVY